MYLYLHGCQTSNGLSASTIIWVVLFALRVQGAKLVWTSTVFVVSIPVLLPCRKKCSDDIWALLAVLWWIVCLCHEIFSIESSLPENHIESVASSAWGYGQVIRPNGCCVNFF
jgi:hypothetical protein